MADTATDKDGHEWLKLLPAKKPDGSFGWVPAGCVQALNALVRFMAARIVAETPVEVRR